MCAFVYVPRTSMMMMMMMSCVVVCVYDIYIYIYIYIWRKRSERGFIFVLFTGPERGNEKGVTRFRDLKGP